MSFQVWFGEQSPMKRLAMIAGAIAGITGAITGTATAWNTLGWPDVRPVLRYHLAADRGELLATQKRTEDALIDLQVDSLDDRWEKADDQIFKLEMDLKKADDAIVQRDIKVRLRKLIEQQKGFETRSLKIKAKRDGQ